MTVSDAVSRSMARKVSASLARIAERDRDLRAWTHVDVVGAHRQAEALDRIPVQQQGDLHGVTIGVKDVIAVAGLPLTHNSPLYTGHVANEDAACVETLRAAGAIILGKTDTTEFAAAGRNAVTANPHDTARTPGGSSAGSAAAVADGHVDVALATQTGGSTIRPASFCGVHGFKPSWGLVSREGVKAYAYSFDTVGWHARSLDLIDRLCQTFGFSAPEPANHARPPRIGIFRTPWWPSISEDGQAAFDGVVAKMIEAGISVEVIDMLPYFECLNDDHRVILFREGAAAFRNLVHARGDLLHADFHERGRALAQFSDERLREARDRATQAMWGFEAAMAELDAVLAPSAPGIAPLGRSPGSPVFNQPWTLLQAPVLNLPLARGEGDMPIGVSLVAPRYRDRALIATARIVEDMLASVGMVPTDAF